MNRTTQQSEMAIRRQRPTDAFLKRMGLAPNCTENDVRSAYLRLAKSAHPDRGGDAQVFRQLRIDYESALRYSRKQGATRVHSFFLNPWNAATDGKQLRRSIAILITSTLFFAAVSIFVFVQTRSFVWPALIVGLVVGGAYICVTAGFHPLVSVVNCVVVVVFFAFVVATLIQDQFFVRMMSNSQMALSDLSVQEQTQIGLFAVFGIFLPLSMLSCLAAVTDRWTG
ncbi:MAG: hypothetical protein KDB27_12780 [Planctomycetales bacterium]|nr:hypothetical protein [Planctomycetales bacterium]